MKKNIFNIFCLLGYFCVARVESHIPVYICTAANGNYFPHLINMIGSLHRVNFDELEELAVFDIGLTEKQRAMLQKIEKVKLYNVELTHPNLLKPMFVNNAGKTVPGCYAWKPVIIKQSLDMFPYVLYMDAGTTILKSLNDLFKHIIQNGYFLTDCGHDIRWMTTKYVIAQFKLNSPENRWILDSSTCGVAGSPQGLTHAVYDNYVMPMYELTKTFRSFVDDGTTPEGFGTARHDQALFSVIARLQKFDVHVQDNGDGRMITLNVDDKPTKIHITWKRAQVREQTVIFSSRSHMPQFAYYKKCIRFKKVDK
jgi:hypothetical protein